MQLLGYAAGVGKTYKMLEEARRLKQEGHDVAVGYFEPHGRKDTIAKMEGLEMIPRRRIEHRSRELEEMDTAAILIRHPEICAVDEFPHTNIPGSERTKRWEDVMVLLEAGIDVMTTMNIQHLESLNDQMREITGVQVRETIPDWVVQQADEVILVDLPPRALLNRLQRGVIYGAEKAERALINFFKEPALAALREMALRQAAHEIDLRQTEGDHFQAGANASEPDAHEAILIHVTDSPATCWTDSARKRAADDLAGRYRFAVCVPKAASLASLPTQTREALERHLDFARKLQIETRVLEGDNEAETLVDFARRNGVTQIFPVPVKRAPVSFLGKRDLCDGYRAIGPRPVSDRSR